MSESKTETQTQQAVPAAEPPKPKMADGLFKPFTLGSTLSLAESGNVMSNLKRSPMDYEKQYQGSTKNQPVSAEELEKLSAGEVKKAKNDVKYERCVQHVKEKQGGAKGPANPWTVCHASVKKSEEIIAEVPEDQRQAVLDELERRIEEAKKSNNETEVQLLEKAKEKAKKCYGSQMDYKQPKTSEMK